MTKSNSAFLFHSETFHLAFRLYYFDFSISAVEEVGSWAQDLVNRRLGGGAPIVNVQPEFGLEDDNRLSHPYSIHVFGRTGPITPWIGGIELALLRLSQTQFRAHLLVASGPEFRDRYRERSLRGPIRTMKRSDWKRLYPENVQIKHGLDRGIQINFNSLDHFHLDFRKAVPRALEKFVPARFRKKIVDANFQIFHCEKSIANTKFWESIGLFSPQTIIVPSSESPFSFHFGNFSGKFMGVSRSPPNQEIGDPQIRSIHLPAFLHCLQQRTGSLFLKAAHSDSRELFKVPWWVLRKGSYVKKALDTINLRHAESRILKSLPVIRNRNEERDLPNYKGPNGSSLLHIIIKEARQDLNNAIPLLSAQISEGNSALTDLQTRATNRLAHFVAVLTLVGTLLGTADILTTLYTPEFRSYFGLSKK